MGSAPIVSHGRGGQGNISADSTEYVDAEITRQGPEGDQGDGAYSAGRGGAGNIAATDLPPTTKQPHDADIIPVLAIHPSQEGDYHTGRGGQGNFIQQSKSADDGAKENEEDTSKRRSVVVGLADMLKTLLGKKRE
ncbi:hypothetical protein PAAG_00640 [Paracoccidioides lutzii Pb01]|uniref:Uncharacterized protein n=1 Tax=Paracoccidioides lutzii (strain ATCC MYA-826 / Pb01) TaxID=502779 RepID=C1GQ45_PARBA|nr:hypothetical protein PAAG_00640 [Paracoccidioides lutzii Pb01]EEH37719.2 hypothetical protein PAAG_00640 [Paracoccidioides lutzii Pb01]